ncbi:MAG: hypothetical protein WCW52_03745 [Elusimicrobiales bacterium]
MRKVSAFFCSLLITAPGFVFAGSALDELRSLAQSAPETAPAASFAAGSEEPAGTAPSPAWQDAEPEQGLTAEQTFWENFEEGAVLPDLCQYDLLPISYDYVSNLGTLGGSAERRFSSYPNGRLALVDEIGLSIGYDHEKDKAFFEDGKNMLAKISPEFSITGGVSLKGSSTVVRPLKEQKSCKQLEQLKKILNLPEFKTAIPFKAGRFAKMQVGEIWKLPVSFWLGINPTVSGGYANAGLALSFGAEKEATPSVSLYRMSEKELRVRVRLDQARIINYGAQAEATIVPVEDALAFVAAEIIERLGRERGQAAVDLLMPYLEEYTYASLGISQERVKEKKALLEFILDPNDPKQMEKLAYMLNKGNLGTIKELAKLAVKRVFLPDHDGKLDEAALTQAAKSWEAKLGVASSYNGVNRISEKGTAVHIHIPVLRKYERVYGSGYQRINTPGSKVVLHVHENTLERTGGWFDIPFTGTEVKHDRSRAVAVFNQETAGSVSQPVLKYEHFEAELRHTKDSARRVLENANSVMRYAGAKGGPLNPAAAIPLNDLQENASRRAGRLTPSSYMTFALVVNEKGVQDILKAPETMVVKAYFNTLSADEKGLMLAQINDKGMVNFKPVAGSEKTVRHHLKKAMKIVADIQQSRMGPGGYAKDWKEQSARLSKMISGDSKSDLKYDEVLKVLVQLTEIGNIQAEIAYYELSGGRMNIAKAKEFNGDNQAFEAAGAYDETVERFEHSAVNTD